jgi:Holliday junction resolvasome RuvABC endonuclease subunit
VIVLGIDPSYTCTGFAVLDIAIDDGRLVAGRERVLRTGTASAPKRPGANDEPKRRELIAKACMRWADEWTPELIAIEEPCRGVNAATDAMLQRLNATVTDALTAAGWTLVQVNNSKRKRALHLHGRTSAELKASAIRVVSDRYGVLTGGDGGRLTSDEADAVGHALAGTQQWLESQKPTVQQLRFDIKRGRARARR